MNKKKDTKIVMREINTQLSQWNNYLENVGRQKK